MTTTEAYRVRFAPSPTGNPHVGNFRTALYNYLLARRSGGQFLLRIEDTDKERSKKEYEDAILDSLRWMGLDFDGEPVSQSARIQRHQEEAERLIAIGYAYRCRCTPARIDALREERKAAGKTPMYDGRCRDANHPAGNEPFCIRLRTPSHGTTHLTDVVRGTITVSNEEIDDLVIVRTDGSPTYNFAVVVDDCDMKITHVIRGDDHINNTVKQILIYEALNYTVPQFAHLPQILGSDKTRLSKRHGAAGVLEYRERGYIPEALINYLARLGWGCGDREVFTKKELIELFSLENVNKSSAVFDPKKLEWLNGEHIRALSPDDLAQRFIEYARSKDNLGPKADSILQNNGLVGKIIECTQIRAKTLQEIIDKVEFLFAETLIYPEEEAKKSFTSETVKALTEAADFAGRSKDRLVSHGEWETVFNEIMKKHEIKMKVMAQVVRLALTGAKVTPPVFDVFDMLGNAEVEKRLRMAVDWTRQHSR